MENGRYAKHVILRIVNFENQLFGINYVCGIYAKVLVNFGHPFRHNPSGAVSGRQLGEAAHRLVANSLQVRADRNVINDRMYVPPPTYSVAYGPPRMLYQNDGFHGLEPIMPQHNTSAQSSVRSHHDHGYRQSYASQAAHSSHYRSHSHYERTDRSVNQSIEYPQHGYYQAGLRQSGGFGYPLHLQHMGRAPLPPGANFYQQGGGYSSFESYQPHGAGSDNHGGSWAPQVDPNVGREYSRPRHPGNQFSALDRGLHRRPPISEHRR